MDGSPSFPHLLELRRATLTLDPHGRALQLHHVRPTNPHAPRADVIPTRRTPWAPQQLLYGLSRSDELMTWAAAHHVHLPAEGLQVTAARARPGGTLTFEAGYLVLRGVTDPDRDRALRRLPSRRVLARVQVFDLSDLAALRGHCAPHAVTLTDRVPGDHHAHVAAAAARRVEDAARLAGHRLPRVTASVISALYGDLLERGDHPEERTGALEDTLLSRDLSTAFAAAPFRHRAGMRRVIIDATLPGPSRHDAPAPPPLGVLGCDA
ncbi:hypothetical protein [Deinococcus soli (ex Cha et al. 2016)]|uniref:hypothetical protein n=1 Tax=Deinococcus soli (ex Cha et al. 2016) TaxID=1309411 RepID=UPI001664DD05|nr:hypothetical protein [Deinococcus soli (ex Cha et al. 2016)]GGB70911.1 hypothetical protein GCM10008019_28860 [Deinococcus soli (ex Cha et al. 2016)]